LNICFVTVDFPPILGGIASHAYELAKALVNLGHQVTVVTPLVPGSAREEEIAGVRVVRPWIPRQRPFYNIWLHWHLRRHLARHPCDIVHVHGMRPLESTRGLKAPVVFTNHTSGFLMRMSRPEKSFRGLLSRVEHVSLVLAPSEELCEATRAIGYKGELRFISNGVDTDRFVPTPRAPSSEPVIVLARRLVEKNGVIVFAKALAAMRSKAFRVLVAGDGPLRPKMQEIIEQAGLAHRVSFIGSVPNHEMPAVYASADISVLPSFYEATSITGLESMACGIPVVGSQVGGIPHLVENGVTGMLVATGDHEALAERLDEIVSKPGRRAEMALASRQRAVERFDWRVIGSETLDAYTAAIIRKNAT